MSLVSYRCGDVNLVNKKIHAALKRYFPLNIHTYKSKNVCIEFLVTVSKTIRIMLNEKQPAAVMFSTPHDDTIEYMGIRNTQIKRELNIHFPKQLADIIFALNREDMSYTKVNTATRLLDDTTYGISVLDTHVRFYACVHVKALFNNVNIDKTCDSTFVDCTFVNCVFKDVRKCIFTRCTFTSCSWVCNITDTTIYKCAMRDCIVKCAEISACKITATNLVNSVFIESNITNTELTKCDILNIKILATDIATSLISFCRIKQCFIGRVVLLSEIEIKRTFISDITICSINIQECEIRDTDIEQIVIIDASISNSIISAHMRDAFINDLKVLNTYVKCQFTNVNSRSMFRDNVTGSIVKRNVTDVL